MSLSTLQVYWILTDLFILGAALFGSSLGTNNLQSLSLSLDNDQIFSGRSNKIHFGATIYQNESAESSCGAWELYVWISPTNTTNEMKDYVTTPTQALTNRQRNYHFEGSSLMSFENVTYEANLNDVGCEDVNFMCARFNSHDVNCTSPMTSAWSCVAINCKAIVMVQGITVHTDNDFSINNPKDILLNVTINYNLDSGITSIPSMPNLWKLRVWLGAHSNGSHPRWSLSEQTLSEGQRRQELVAGEQFGFRNILYSPNIQDLKNAKFKDVRFICARFLLGSSSNGVKLESSRGTLRTNCTEIAPCDTTTSAATMTTSAASMTTSQLTSAATTTTAPTTILRTTALPIPTPMSTAPSVSVHALNTEMLSSLSTSSPTITTGPSSSSPSVTTGVEHKTSLPTISAEVETRPVDTQTFSLPAVTDQIEITSDLSEVSFTIPVTPKDITERQVTKRIASNLENLSQIDVSDENVELVAENLVALTTEVLPDSTNQMEAISATLQNIAEIESVSPEVVKLSLTTVDNILQLENSMLQPSNQRSTIVTSLQKILANLHMDPNGDSFAAALTNIALVALSMRTEDALNGITFNVKQSVLDEAVNVTWSYDENVDDTEGDSTAWLTLQGELFKQTPDISDIRTNIIVYQNDKLFQASSKINQSESASCPHVPSNVIGAELLVNGDQVTQLDHSVKMVFNTRERNITWKPSCEFWDFNDAGNQGNWSSNGCHVVHDDGGQVTCQCNHLTNFAVLMSPKYGCYGNPYFLDVLSKIGCAISIIALILTCLTYTVYKNLMGRTPQLILVQWTLSLIFLYTVFLFGIDWSYNSTLCTVIAALLHYFTLTSIFWMGSEAASLFLVFVKGVTIVPRPQKFLPIAATLAWGLPAVIVLTSFFIVGEEDYRHSDFCYLRRGAHFYLGLLLPIGCVLFTNIIVFILVLRAITCRRSGSMLAKSQSTEGTRTIQQVLSIAVLVGITWVFGLLAIEGAAVVFNVLFCIFNTLQGLAVFLLFCVRRREVREAWSNTFCFTRKQTYQLSQRRRSRSGTASSRTDLYNVTATGGYRSRSGTGCSRTDAVSFNSSVAFDKV